MNARQGMWHSATICVKFHCPAGLSINRWFTRMAPDSTISPFVFAVVLLAAAMHAGWNAFLKVRLEPLLALALIVAGAGIVAVPMVVVFGWTRAEAWP